MRQVSALCRRKTMLSTSLLLILGITLISTVPVPKVFAQTTRIYLDPSENIFYGNTTSVGDRFNFTIWVSDVADLFAWQVSIRFSPLVLNFTKAEYPSDHVFAGQGFTPVEPSIPYAKLNSFSPNIDLTNPLDSKWQYGTKILSLTNWQDIDINGNLSRTDFVWLGETGKPSEPYRVREVKVLEKEIHMMIDYPIVEFGATLLLGQPTFTGSGKLAIMEFEIIASPPKNGEASSSLDINNENTFLLDSNAEPMSTTKEGGSFHYFWSEPPTRPYLAVDPTLVEFGPSPPSAVGQEFDIGVNVVNLDPLWNLHNVTFSLSYNSTIIDVIDYTVARLWTTSEVNVTQDESYQKLDVFVGNPIVNPDGTVLLVNVKFNVTRQGIYPAVDESSLTLGDIKLMDTQEEIQTTSPVDGKVRIIGLLTMPLEVRVPPYEPGNNTYITDKLESFTVEVWLNNIAESDRIIAVSFRLRYNATLLKVLNIPNGKVEVTNGDGHRFSAFIISIDVTKNETKQLDDPYFRYGPHVFVGFSILAEAGEFPHFLSGEVLLANITFQGIYRGFHPEKNYVILELVDASLINDKIKEITPSTIPGYYEITSMAIPTLKMEPVYYEARKKDETFNINVTLNYLSVEAQFNSTEFKLKYNTSLLEALNVVEGSFLPRFGDTFFNYTMSADTITIKNYLRSYTSFPEGNGTIATITFKTIYRGFYPEENNCTLSLVEIILLNASQKEIPSRSENGTYRIISYRIPVAQFTYSPDILKATISITFNASESFDYYPELGYYIATYTWDFGDGTLLVVTNQTITQHAYMTPGTYEVNLTVTDDDGLTNSVTKSITVMKLSSTISVAVLPATITFDESTTISGVISPARSKVDVTLVYMSQGETEWKPLAVTSTGNNGTYSHSWKPPKTGTYYINASWLGDKITAPAQNVATLTVKIAPSIITISAYPEKVTVGSEVTISGVVQPIRVNSSVIIAHRIVKGALKGAWRELATVKTSSLGRYSYTWKITEIGTFEVKAIWQGDADTLPSESSASIIKVEARPVDILLYTTVAAFILILIVATSIFYKKIRKHKPSLSEDESRPIQ